MNLAEYREQVVATTECPACLVPAGEKCIRLPEPGDTTLRPGFVEYVHDDRSLQHHEMQMRHGVTREELIRHVVRKLASVNNLPDWLQSPALGRDMLPIAELVVDAISGVTPLAEKELALLRLPIGVQGLDQLVTALTVLYRERELFITTDHQHGASVMVLSR